MAETNQINDGRRAFNAQRFATMTPTELDTMAKKMNDERILRAAGSIAQYAMVGYEGELLHRPSGRSYMAEDVFHVRDEDGEELIFVNCDCPDSLQRLSPLKDALNAAKCRTQLECKHTHARNLYAGHKIRTSRGVTVKLKNR